MLIIIIVVAGLSWTPQVEAYIEILEICNPDDMYFLCFGSDDSVSRAELRACMNALAANHCPKL